MSDGKVISLLRSLFLRTECKKIIEAEEAEYPYRIQTQQFADMFGVTSFKYSHMLSENQK